MLRKLYSQAGQDHWVIRDVFGFMTGGFFLDIGAAGGVELSNTYALERYWKWSGLCVEADPESWEQLRSRRSCECVNTCLDAERGEVEFTSGQGFFGGIVSADSTSAHAPTRRMKTETLANLFLAKNVPRTIHYMSLDVEGFEERVMAGFPFDTHKFLCATIERPGEALRSRLRAEGYLLVQEQPELDAYFLHPSMKDSYVIRAMDAAARRAKPVWDRLGSGVSRAFKQGIRTTLGRL